MCRWHWHPLDKTRKHCNACYLWFRDKGYERPQKVYEKYDMVQVCADCSRTSLDVQGIWQPVRDETGAKTGAYRCPACATALRRRNDALAAKNDDRRCHYCKNTDLSVEWHTVRCCKRCWNDLKRNDELKKRRDRRECFSCRVPFEPVRPRQRSQNDRQWCESLSQWLCSNCRFCVENHQCLRLTRLHLTGLEIRCEFCETLHCPRWVMFFTDKKDPKALVYLICVNCKNHINRGKPPESLKGIQRDHEIGWKDMTFQGWRDSKKTLHNNLEIVLYIRRHLSIDFTVEGVLQTMTRYRQRQSDDEKTDLLNMIANLGIFPYPGMESMDWD